MKHAFLFVFLAFPALATERYSSSPAPNQEQAQDQDQSQAQSQTNSQSQSSSLTQSQGNSQSIGGDRAYAFANGAPIPGACPQGFLPGKGLKRGHSQLFGASAWSAVCVRDDEWWAELVKQAEHQRAMDLAKVELEKEKIKLETLRLQNCTECGVRK